MFSIRPSEAKYDRINIMLVASYHVTEMDHGSADLKGWSRPYLLLACVGVGVVGSVH